jgi:DNA (cytosine-5)-methyltransferase 1
LDGDIGGLLPCDGLSVVLERAALKGYGNAIVPQVAAEVIGAYMEAA